MAKRFVYKAVAEPPYCTPLETIFTYYSGFSLAQKQRCIASLHQAYGVAHPEDHVLEISTKSTEPLGVALSAFNLTIATPAGSVCVECAFQSGKVFEFGGPYQDLLEVSPVTAKRDERLRSSGAVVGFRFDGVDYPTEPKDLFYCWLYVNALTQDDGLFRRACAYDAFTDIEFNPAKSINCQAKAAALAVGLERAGLIGEALENVDSFALLAYGLDGLVPEAYQPTLF